MPSLREHSRQEYLTKRELQQIELLRKEIAEKQETLASFDMEEAARARRQFEEQYPKEEAKMQELQSQVRSPPRRIFCYV